MVDSTQENGFISVPEFQEFMFHHIVPLSDLQDFKGEPLSKMVTVWRKYGLVPFIEKGKWVRISFAELIWLRILDTLRQFHFPVERIKAIVKYFFLDAYEHNLPMQNFEYTQQKLLQAKSLGTIDEKGKQMLRYLDHLTEYPQIMESAKLDVNYLTNLMLHSLDSGEEARILIFGDGSVVEQLGLTFFKHDGPVKNLSKPHLKLSIREYLEEFIDAIELSNTFLPMLFSEDEEKVIKQMHNKRVNQIIIHQKGGVRRIETRTSKFLSTQQQEKIKKIIGLKNYEKIEIDSVDQKIVTLVRTNKRL
jgi:hypothetical protein